MVSNLGRALLYAKLAMDERASRRIVIIINRRTSNIRVDDDNIDGISEATSCTSDTGIVDYHKSQQVKDNILE